MFEVAGASALEIARAVGARDVSPVEVIEAALTRIEEKNPAVNAVTWAREQAIEDARAAEKRLAGGADARAFEGVPFTAKELAAIADGPTTLASRAFAGMRLSHDAEVIARLRRAGAILVGKTTSPELGYRPTTESDLFGPTRNPWNTERTSGGSSGGAAVSAALGIAPLNQGSDGGGSIRIPAAACGAYGLKPTRARISLGPYLSEEWLGLVVYGALTRTVADTAAFLDIASGPSTGDPYWAPPPERPFAAALEDEPPLRIAVAFERDGERVDPEVIAAVRATASLLSGAGHAIEEAQPDLLPLQEPFVTITTVGMLEIPMTPEQVELLEPRNRFIRETALNVPTEQYVRALSDAHAHCRQVARFFETYDALLTPTLSRPAPRIGEIGASIEDAWDDYRNWICWTWPFNVTGQPAASIPAGLSSDGLPIGVQVVGRYADEHTVLTLSAQLERARPWAQHHPPLW